MIFLVHVQCFCIKSVNPGKYLVAKELNKLDLCANMYILFKSPKFACLCDTVGDGDDAVGDGDDAGGAGDKQW